MGSNADHRMAVCASLGFGVSNPGPSAYYFWLGIARAFKSPLIYGQCKLEADKTRTSKCAHVFSYLHTYIQLQSIAGKHNFITVTSRALVFCVKNASGFHAHGLAT